MRRQYIHNNNNNNNELPAITFSRLSTLLPTPFLKLTLSGQDGARLIHGCDGGGGCHHRLREER